MSCKEKMCSTEKYKRIECLIANKDIESVKITLQKSTDLCELMNAIGETLIHLAVNHRCIDLIHWLLQNQIDVNSLDFAKKTALHLAVSLKFDDVVECLLNYNAKLDAKDCYGNSPFHLAVIGGSISIIQFFFNHGADVMDTTSENLNTCFHLAVLDENYEVFELLLQNYKGSMDVSNAYGETVLHQLTRKNNKRLVRMLLERRVNFEKVNQVQDTPLHVASQERNHSIVELLLEYAANVNVKNIYNESPLHIAIRNRDVKLVKLLLYYGANAKALSSNNNSVLHLVINYYSEAIFKILLNLNIDIDVKNGDNFTPFHLAIADRNIDAARKLLNRGANVNSVSSKSWISYQLFDRKNYTYKNLSPLQTAIILKDVDTVKLLLKKGAKVDLENQTETFLAVDVVSCEILEILLRYGAKLNIVNKEGESLLYRAMKYYNVRLTETLLVNGANMRDISVMETSDEPILHLAVKAQQYKFIQFLLSLGVDINVLDSNKQTALKYANECSIIEILITHIALKKINNGLINEQNQYILDSFSDCRSFYAKCLAELDKIKEVKSSGISVLVFLTKNKISSSKVFRNSNAVKEFLEILCKEKYPIYFKILLQKMIKAAQRWNLEKEATSILNSFACFDILYDVIDNILDNFSNNELEQLIKSFTAAAFIIAYKNSN